MVFGYDWKDDQSYHDMECFLAPGSDGSSGIGSKSGVDEMGSGIGSQVLMDWEA